MAKVFHIETDPATVAGLKKSVQYVMSLSEKQMLAIVPTQSGIYFTDCPNCEKGTQDRGRFAWSPERPTEIVCKDCGARYPGNPKYPDDKVLGVAGPGGPQRYPYYERPNDKYRIFFRAHADYWAQRHMEKQCRLLAELYWATKDETYARRSALILLRFAQVYPGYAYHFDYPFHEKKFAPWTQNHIEGTSPYRTAKWDWWAYMDLSLDLVKAYDCLREWPGLKKMAKGRAVKMIEEDLLTAMTDFVLGIKETYSNMSPYLWRDVIYAGRVMGKPEWVNEVIGRAQRFTRERFLHDGHWMETSPSYCGQVRGILRIVMSALKGYEGPAVADVAAELQAVWDGVDAALLAPRFPNGRLLPVNDTWWSSQRAPRKKMTPLLMPGLGVAVMGGGEGKHQLHAYLNFTSGTGHKHADALSLGLFAFGKELLADIGYTHTKYRAWANSMMSHNSVVVNGRESGFDPNHAGNRLRAFVTDGRGFHLAEAESLTAYSKTVTRYRRTLITVGADSRDCYLVDVFQVAGGEQHDYLLHGSADDDSAAALTGAKMTPFAGTLMNPGVKFVPPRGEGDRPGPEAAYGFVHDLLRGAARGIVALEMHLNESPKIGTRTLLLPQENTTLYLGQAPSIRRARRADALVDKHQAPFFCARRRGKDLRSVFVAVHEPLNGKPKISNASVTRSSRAIVLAVDRGLLGKDTVVIALDRPATVHREKLSFQGRYGFVRVRAGRVTEAHLVGGTQLRFGNVELKGPAGWRGSIRKVIRSRSNGAGGAFEVAERVPPDCAPCTLIVHHADGTVHGYNVIRIESMARGSRLFVREDPGFEMTRDGKTEFLRYPQRTIQGAKNTYEIMNALHVYPKEKT